MAPPRPQPPDLPGEPPDDDDLEGTGSSEPLSLKGAFGTALGASMLGLEQALRDGPPPQIRAAEQTPDESTISGTSDLTIEFPDATVGAEED